MTLSEAVAVFLVLVKVRVDGVAGLFVAALESDGTRYIGLMVQIERRSSEKTEMRPKARIKKNLLINEIELLPKYHFFTPAIII